MAAGIRAPDIPRGPCGAPGCTDPDCAIEFHTCHCGCGERTASARQTCRRNLLVQGEPQRYVHRHGGARGRTNRWAPTAADREQRRERALDLYAELRSVDAVAAKLAVDKTRVWHDIRDSGLIRRLEDDELTVDQAVREHPGLFKAETLAAAIDAGRVPGERIVSSARVRRIVRRADLERGIAEMKCGYYGCDLPAFGASGGCDRHSAAMVSAGIPRSREVRRKIVVRLMRYHGPAMRGRHAKLIAEGKGKRVGRTPMLLTDEKKVRILKLRSRMSQRQIGIVTGVSRGSVRHVLATYFLDEHGALQEVG